MEKKVEWLERYDEIYYRRWPVDLAEILGQFQFEGLEDEGLSDEDGE